MSAPLTEERREAVERAFAALRMRGVSDADAWLICDAYVAERVERAAVAAALSAVEQERDEALNGTGAGMWKAVADEYKAQLNAVTTRLVQQRRRLRELETNRGRTVREAEREVVRLKAQLAEAEGALAAIRGASPPAVVSLREFENFARRRIESYFASVSGADAQVSVQGQRDGVSVSWESPEVAPAPSRLVSGADATEEQGDG